MAAWPQTCVVSFAAVFWMSHKAPLRDIQKTTAKETKTYETKWRMYVGVF